jgi:hypothetical protein
LFGGTGCGSHCRKYAGWVGQQGGEAVVGGLTGVGTHGGGEVRLQRVSVLVGIMVLGGCDRDDPVQPNLLADIVSDITPPTLTAVGFSPASIDINNGSAAVIVTYGVTDDLSGATYVQAGFRSPSGTVFRYGSSSFAASLSQTGSFEISFPQFGESGTWILDNVYVTDAIGNNRTFSTTDLSAMGFATTLSVSSTSQDITPPALATFDFTPKTISTSNGSATVAVSFGVTDDLSGATYVQAGFRSPSGTVFRYGSSSFAASLNQTGSFEISFPQFSESGTWILDNVYVTDAIGNNRTFSTTDLAAVGFPTVLSVTNGLTVAIDIQPGNSVNSIKLSKQGKVTVAILSDGSFDAPSRAGRSSLTFGHNGNEASLASCAKDGEDVNRDGFKDLVCQFYVQRTGFQVGDVEGILRGRTVDQVPIEGKDAVRVLK